MSWSVSSARPDRSNATVQNAKPVPTQTGRLVAARVAGSTCGGPGLAQQRLLAVCGPWVTLAPRPRGLVGLDLSPTRRYCFPSRASAGRTSAMATIRHSDGVGAKVALRRASSSRMPRPCGSRRLRLWSRYKRSPNTSGPSPLHPRGGLGGELASPRYRRAAGRNWCTEGHGACTRRECTAHRLRSPRQGRAGHR